MIHSRRSSSAAFFFLQPQDQQAVVVIAADRRVLDIAGELNRLLKTAVSYLHLLIAVPLFEKRISPATANPQT